jgi:hypothetical protein
MSLIQSKRYSRYSKGTKEFTSKCESHLSSFGAWVFLFQVNPLLGLAIDSLYYLLYFKYSLGLEDELKAQALKGLKPKECLDIVEALSKERTKILFMIFANITDLILAWQYMGYVCGFGKEKIGPCSICSRQILVIQ